MGVLHAPKGVCCGRRSRSWCGSWKMEWAAGTKEAGKGQEEGGRGGLGLGGYSGNDWEESGQVPLAQHDGGGYFWSLLEQQATWYSVLVLSRERNPFHDRWGGEAGGLENRRGL